jgi:muramoyltetrapeptide carboxypeptidase
MILPARLGPGARVSLVAAAGPLPEGGIERASARVKALGWEPLLGKFAGGRWGYLAGRDEERLADLTEALQAPDNDAIWLLRGGYGTMRLLDRLDLTPLRDRPRPLVGFSDNTALHLAARRHDVVTFHGPHPAPREFPAFSLDGLRTMLTTPHPLGELPLPADATERPISIAAGVAEGPLIGGNLALLAATVGTPYQMDARGAILFLEEVGESMYRIDRLLTQLLLAGLLHEVEGIAVGGVTECPDAGTGSPTPAEIVEDRLGSLGVPIAIGFPFGHLAESWTLPYGIRARLDATAGTLALLEPAVR